MRLAIEDGAADGDEAIDNYLIPTWGDETVLDVLARYFPHTTDENGMLIAVWTPEYRADTPTWCAEPQAVGTGSQRTLWCKHALSTADWWNVYTNGMGDGSEGFQDTPAAPGGPPCSASTRTATSMATPTARRNTPGHGSQRPGLPPPAGAARGVAPAPDGAGTCRHSDAIPAEHRRSTMPMASKP